MSNFKSYKVSEQEAREIAAAAIQEAVDFFGSQDKLAKALVAFLDKPEISQSHVSHWVLNGTLLDAFYWDAFEELTKGMVTRQRLRADIFGKDRAA